MAADSEVQCVHRPYTHTQEQFGDRHPLERTRSVSRC